MNAHVVDLLPELALGLVGAAERKQIEKHLEGCDSCSREAVVSSELFAAVAEQAVPIEPPPALKDRLLASLAKVNRFEHLAERFANLLKVGLDKARELLFAIDDPASWQPGPGEGVELFYLQTGPEIQGALAGFVRLRPGATFPQHSHRGDERALVLQGAMKDIDGSVLSVGDDDFKAPGTAHAITALPGPPCIYAAVVIDGIDVPGYNA